MHLAYFATSTITTDQCPPKVSLSDQFNSELMLRYQAYQTACNNYSREIASIQKYLPGWMPSPPTA
jgi:hypothetical protein